MKKERSANVRVPVRNIVVQVHVERTSVRGVVPVPADIGVLLRTTNPDAGALANTNIPALLLHEAGGLSDMSIGRRPMKPSNTHIIALAKQNDLAQKIYPIDQVVYNFITKPSCLNLFHQSTKNPHSKKINIGSLKKKVLVLILCEVYINTLDLIERRF
ncbi:MAG: hypothetical protein NC548_52235 [Lachnospiraceae bacterium]|nr:hypothetical protein [Lachnospiraceae bacterium]